MTIRYFIFRLLPYFFMGMGLYVFRSAWFALVGYHVGIVLILGLYKQFGLAAKVKPNENGLSAWLVWLIGLSAGILLYVLWSRLVFAPNIVESLKSLGLNQRTWPFFIIYFALVNPLLEEIYWRAFLGSPSQRLILDDLWFAAYHLLVLSLYTNLHLLVLALTGLVFAAWMWRQIVNRTGSLFTPVISHLLADFSILSAVYLRTMI